MFTSGVGRSCKPWLTYSRISQCATKKQRNGQCQQIEYTHAFMGPEKHSIFLPELGTVAFRFVLANPSCPFDSANNQNPSREQCSPRHSWSFCEYDCRCRAMFVVYPLLFSLVGGTSVWCCWLEARVFHGGTIKRTVRASTPKYFAERKPLLFSTPIRSGPRERE